MQNEYFDPQDIQKNKVICAISYLGILFFLPLVACPESAFVKFHANQALLFLITGVVVNVVSWVLAFIPFLGWLISIVLGLLTFALFLYCLINTLNGQAKELPVIGSIRILK